MLSRVSRQLRKQKVQSFNPVVVKRNTIKSILNPFVDLALLSPSESVLYERVQGYLSTLTLTSALLVGVSAAVVFSGTDVTKQVKYPAEFTSYKESRNFITCIRNSPWPLLKEYSASLSFLINSTCLIFSSLLLGGLNATPAGRLRSFVTSQATMIATVGWGLAPGLFSLCGAAVAVAQASFPYPICDLFALGYGFMIFSASTAGLVMIFQNHRFRSKLIDDILRRQSRQKRI